MLLKRIHMCGSLQVSITLSYNKTANKVFCLSLWGVRNPPEKTALLRLTGLELKVGEGGRGGGILSSPHMQQKTRGYGEGQTVQILQQ